MKDINTIWISTTPRTGSMWIFNATREIYRTLGYNVEPSVVPQKDSEMFKIYHYKAINENDDNIKYVLKTHSILKQNLVRSKIITTIRDPRDVCLSFKKFMKSDFKKSLSAAKGLINFSKTYKNFDKKYLLFLKYEDFLKNPKEIILKISKFLNTDITSNQAIEISKKYSRENVIKIVNKKNKQLNEKISKKMKIDEKERVFISNNNFRSYDESTGFQTGHVSENKSGDWKVIFSEDEKKILNNEFKNWLNEFNYL